MFTNSIPLFFFYEIIPPHTQHTHNNTTLSTPYTTLHLFLYLSLSLSCSCLSKYFVSIMPPLYQINACFIPILIFLLLFSASFFPSSRHPYSYLLKIEEKKTMFSPHFLSPLSLSISFFLFFSLPLLLSISLPLSLLPSLSPSLSQTLNVRPFSTSPTLLQFPPILHPSHTYTTPNRKSTHFGWSLNLDKSLLHVNICLPGYLGWV